MILLVLVVVVVFMAVPFEREKKLAFGSSELGQVHRALSSHLPVFMMVTATVIGDKRKSVSLI